MATFKMLTSKKTNRWRVVFYDGNKQQIAKALSEQATDFIGRPVAVGADLIDENNDWLIYEMNLGAVIPFFAHVIVQDDETNKAAIDLYELTDHENFTVSLQILDGQGVMIESFTMTEANVAEIEMNELDFALSDPLLKNITLTYENAVHSIKKQP
jgi:hypothetical protein